MNLPQFVLADNSNFPDAIFVIHLDYPRFIINLEDGDLTFLEPVDESDENDSCYPLLTTIKTYLS